MGDQSADPLPNALVVDDEKEVADAYALRLRGTCDVQTVYDGSSALDTVATGDFDIVLLDRHMPGMSGDDVLAELDEREFDGRVIMVTAIDPGFDVLDMPFDDYLCKPVEREDVRAAVDQQCTTLGYELLGEYFSVEATCRVIEAELSGDELDDHDEYQAATERASALRQRVRRLLDDAAELFETFESVEREG
jgi:DNA-binding response OmpR family regulator